MQEQIMRNRGPILFAVVVLVAAILAAVSLPAAADDFRPHRMESPLDFRPIPLPKAAEIVATRYDGRLIAARLTGPRATERALGAELVEELRLLTPQGNVLMIRLDARTGRFLEVAGVGQTEARR